jgi:hypothetical protein
VSLPASKTSAPRSKVKKDPLSSPYRQLLDAGRRVEVPRFPFTSHDGRQGACFVRMGFDQKRQNVVLLLTHLYGACQGKPDLTPNLEDVARSVIESVLTAQEIADERYRIVEHIPVPHSQYGRDEWATIMGSLGQGFGWNYCAKADVCQRVDVPTDFLDFDPDELNL